MEPIRWAGEGDRYFGPFTYSRDRRGYRPFGIMLGSDDGDDYPGCRIRFSAFGHTFIAALPPIIKPWKRWIEIKSEPTRSQMIEQGRKPGYWDCHEREYGFSAVEGALHLHYGPQTHDSETSKVKVWFYPWCEHRCVRHSIYDLAGDLFATLPEWGLQNKNGWEAKNALENACPVARFEFADYDGERITATCRIEEREWKRGKGLFRLFYLGRNTIRRSLDLRFSSEVGRRKGSWKGGTIGHSIDMLPGELHQSAFERYCQQKGLTFIGEGAAKASHNDVANALANLRRNCFLTDTDGVRRRYDKVSRAVRERAEGGV